MTPALVERLAEGRIVALLTDRDIKGKGIEVEFFGERTTMPAGSAALAERTGAALFPSARSSEKAGVMPWRCSLRYRCPPRLPGRNEWQK